MASRATPLLIAARGHSALGRRQFDLQNRPQEAFRACSVLSRKPPRQSGPGGATIGQRDVQRRITTKTQSVNNHPTSRTLLRVARARCAGRPGRISRPRGLNWFHRQGATGRPKASMARGSRSAADPSPPSSPARATPLRAGFCHCSTRPSRVTTFWCA